MSPSDRGVHSSKGGEPHAFSTGATANRGSSPTLLASARALLSNATLASTTSGGSSWMRPSRAAWRHLGAHLS
eukprot:5259466-Alexandrium_andersonii.AAC.1